MKNGCRAACHKIIGAEKQKRSYRTAENTDKTHRGKCPRRDLKAASAYEGEGWKERQREKISHQHEGYGINSVRINMLCHQRHTAEDNGTDYNKRIAFYILFGHSVTVKLSCLSHIFLQ